MVKYLVATFCLIMALGLLGWTWVFQTYNHLIELRNNIDVQWAEVQNQYQRRADLIPNLVQVVTASAQFERSTLVAVAQARANVGRVSLESGHAPADAAKLRDFQKAQDSLGSALARLLVVSEQYPEFKASGNFSNLQVQLEGTENRITFARYNFNFVTEQYDVAIQRFPVVFCARHWGFVSRPYFAVPPKAETVPEINLFK